MHNNSNMARLIYPYISITVLTVSFGLLWLLRLLKGSDLCPQTNTPWEHACTHVGWGSFRAIMLPGVSACEKACYSENILQALPPSRSVGNEGEKELGKPRYRGQFVV